MATEQAYRSAPRAAPAVEEGIEADKGLRAAASELLEGTVDGSLVRGLAPRWRAICMWTPTHDGVYHLTRD